MKRKGKVSKIGKSQYSYYIQLDGDGFYFNTKYDPKCGVGDVVGIEYDKKGDQRGQIKKVTVLEDSGGPKGYQQSSGGGGRSGGGRSYGGNDDSRQESIIFQSSRKDALVAVELLLSNGAIALPKGENERRTVIEELIDELTVRYAKDATDPSKACKNAREAEDDSSESGGSDEWDDSSNDGDDWDNDAEWE